ncbi:MAG: 50S ribosomal protein L24 [Candidatus Anoxychlamydiales bacterium]|nr:50S ribosomal protein L24 [Candidatus Anoxychlamydiales bacterium]
MSKWIIKDDTVVVLAGNDKGKAGTVLSTQKDKIIVQGINMRKKHMKRTQKTQSSQIVEMEMPIHISNVAICDKNEKPIKVKVKFENGEKKLVYFENDKEIVLRKLKTKKS